MAAAELLEGGIDGDAGPARKASNIAANSPPPAAGQSATAPWASESFGSLNNTAGFVPVCTPSPSQAGHQPSALLKEKL